MSALPRLLLALLPTPLEAAPALSRKIGIEILIKRDDLTGLALGGNKARKLEYYTADAKARGADTLVTFGGLQSNHARMTAAAAAKAGLACHLLLGGVEPRESDGNLLLDRLLGAQLEFLGLTPAELNARRVEEAFAASETRLRASGRRPYRIPAGGSAPLGVYAYALAFREMVDQAARMGVTVETILVGFGTGGTLAGLALGNILLGRPARIVGISSAPPGMPASLGIPPVEALIRATIPLLETDPTLEWPVAPASLRVGAPGEEARVDYAYAGMAYGAPTEGSAAAIRETAREEGILLDPIYTGKAMAGLMELARQGGIGGRGAVIFVHTGGSPALFPYAGSLLRPPTGGPPRA